MKALLYTRVSTEEQVKFGLSLEAQLEDLKKYCEENHLKIRNIYSDEGISGGSVKKRKALQQMVSDAQSGDIILFTKLDRFSRNLLDANIIVEDLVARNVSIKAIHEDDIDTSTADGKFIFNLKLSLAQREREKVSERITDVFKFKIKNGQAVSGKVPYGYKISQENRFEIDELAASEVRELFNRFIKYQNLTAVTNWWNENHPNDQRSAASIRNQKLRNKFYLGIHPSGLNDSFCEPIIEKYKFDEVQRIFAGNRNSYNPKGNHQTYLFSKMIRCPHCGRVMTGLYGGGGRNPQKYHKHKFYRCNGVYRNKDHLKCDFRKYLQEVNIEREALEGLIAKSQEIADAKLEPIKPQTDNLEKELQKYKSKDRRLKDLYVDGLLARDEFDDKHKEIQDSINQIKTKLNQNITESSNRAMELKDIDIKTLYSKLTDENKQLFWKKYINRIEIDPDTLEINVVYQ